MSQVKQGMGAPVSGQKEQWDHPEDALGWRVSWRGGAGDDSEV